MSTILSAEGLRAGYAGKQVLRAASITIGQGEIAGIIGPNGAGKTTLLRSIAGLVQLDAGGIHYRDEEVSRCSVLQRRRRGLCYVPQERNVFPNLSVRENLEMAFQAGAAEPGLAFAERLDFVYRLFPRLQERAAQPAGSMSGGEQRMVAIGIGLMLKPEVLLLDEPTTGLAPLVVNQLMRAIARLREEQGMSILLVEQNIISMLNILDRLYLMKDGHVRLYEQDPRKIGEQDIWEYL